MFRLISWFGIIRTVCSTILIMALIYATAEFGPMLESKYRPVIVDFKIVRKEAAFGHRTAIYVSFNKIRDCAYIGTAWYKGSRKGGFERVAFRAVNLPNSPSRPTGEQLAGPWVVDIPPDVLEHSFAEYYHQCNPFFITRTPFYDGRNAWQNAEGVLPYQKVN